MMTTDVTVVTTVAKTFTGFEMTVPMVINGSFGSYSLTRAASVEVARRKGWTLREDRFVGDEGYNVVDDLVGRHDPDLVAVVREMGEAAGHGLKVVEVAISVEVYEVDGKEYVRAEGGAY